LFSFSLAREGLVSWLLIVLLAWLGLAVVVIATGLLLTVNKEPLRYLTLLVIADEPSVANVNEAERRAA
jgi:hypothetical protein